MTYKLIGQRVLRKYTAAKTTPTYAAATDAQLVVDSLCDVPWKKVAEKSATMTYHTEENVGTKDEPISGLDMNVRIRDQFDAALFCADHTGGQHRAYANAAVYHYVLPDGTLPRLTKLTASVTSDPYNSAGARITILTNATGEIPTNCNDCRTGDAHADGVAPRTVAANGNWFPTTADCVFSADPGEGETALPSGGLQLQKHLFVFVLLESYSTVRGNWMEGCSFIRNLVSVETDDAVPGWTDGDTIDLAASGVNSYAVMSGGIIHYITGNGRTGERSVSIRTDANLVIESDGSQTQTRPAAGAAAAAALSRLYAAFYSGEGDLPECSGNSHAQTGAAFNVTRTDRKHVKRKTDWPDDTEVVRIDTSALVVPFSLPRDFTPSGVLLSFSELSMSPGARFNVFFAEDFLTSLTEEQLRNPGLYDGQEPPFRLLGTIADGTFAKLALPPVGSRVGTFVITGWMPPESFDLLVGGCQGTGEDAFIPDISIIG